jgi:hypothetical protein
LLFDIKERYYKGKIRPYGKTRRSTSQMPISEALFEKLGE